MKLRAQNDRCEPRGRSKAFALVLTLLVVLTSVALSNCTGYTVAPSAIGQPGNPAPGDPSVGTLSAGPTSVTFGEMAVGSTAKQSVNVTNTGTSAIKISKTTIAGTGFAAVGSIPSGSIPVGGNITVEIQFAPKTDVALTGSLTITSDAANSPLTVPLSGTGTQAQITVTPSSVNFGSVVQGTANSQTILLRNGGNGPLTFSRVTTAGAGYSVTGLSTSTVVPAGGSVTFDASFAPTSTATINGSVTLATNGVPSTLVIDMLGAGSTATVQLGAKPANLNFNTVTVGSSASLTSTLTNVGNSNIDISGVTVTGTNVTTSGVSTGTILTPGQSTTLNVTFAPTKTEVLSGASVKVASNTPNSPTTISVSGTGQAAPPTSHSVALSWTPSVTSGVNGYNIYRATTSGGYGTVPLNPSPVSGTSYTDTTVVAGQTYFYVAAAVDAGVQSTDSNEVQAVIP